MKNLTKFTKNKLHLNLLLKTLEIRKVEEKIIELYPTDKIQSPVHLSIGQEAIAVGFVECLNNDDLIFINYRGHAYYLSKGGDLSKFFAELFGKVTGISKGKAGSMHLAYPDKGVMGASAVVASTIPHTVGAALAQKINGYSNKVFVAIYGDGATEQGVYHESLNFASLHNLPVIFLCENNNLAVHSNLEERQSFNHKKLVESYGITYNSFNNTHDPLDVYNFCMPIVSRIRKTSKPEVIELSTMRYKEHVGPGEDFDASYRSEDEVETWKLKDPLIKYSHELMVYEDKIRKSIQEALDFAEKSDFPNVEELLSDVD